MELEVQVVNRSPAAQLVQFSIGAANLASGLPLGAAGFGASDQPPGAPSGTKPSPRAPLDLSGGPLRPLPSGSQQPQAQFAAGGGGGVDAGVVLLGQLERIRCRLAPSSQQQQQQGPPAPSAVHTQCMAVLFSTPGLYQLYVYDVLAAPEATCQQQQQQGGNAAAQDWVSAGGRPVYVNVQRLNVLVG